jgi:hypothetical protein
MRRNRYISINPGETENMMAAAMTAALNLKLPRYRYQIINPPVSWIVTHGFEQLGPLVHALHSILCDTKYQTWNVVIFLKNRAMRVLLTVD